MLSILTFIDAPEQIEIVGDENGLDELISYLEGIKEQKDHMHLVLDSELVEFPIGEERVNKTLNAKHVRLEYLDSKEWK